MSGKARRRLFNGCSGSWADDTACGRCEGCRSSVAQYRRQIETQQKTIEHWAHSTQAALVKAAESERLRKTAEEEAETMRIRNAELQRMMEQGGVATHATLEGLASALQGAQRIPIPGSYFEQNEIVAERNANPHDPDDETIALHQLNSAGESHIYLTLDGGRYLHHALAVLLSL